MIEVVPRPRRAHRDGGRRICQTGERSQIGTFQIPAEAHLHRRLTVAKEIVCRTQARRDVLPIRDVVHLRKIDVPIGYLRPGAVVLAWYIVVEVIEPQAHVERQPSERPLILGEQADVRLRDFIVEDRKCKHGDTAR